MLPIQRWLSISCSIKFLGVVLGLTISTLMANTLPPDLKGLSGRDSSFILAMHHELKRSMDSLKLPGRPGPYFMSYLVWDLESYTARASLGSLEQSGSQRQLLVDVDLRVGDYRFDNTQYQGGYVYGPSLRSPLPDNGDTVLLRQSLWALSDARYKVALEQYAQKSAFLIQSRQKPLLPDFSRQRIIRHVEKDRRNPPDTSVVKSLVRTLSKSLAEHPKLEESRIGFQWYYTTFYYVDSEGSAYVMCLQEHTLLASMLTQASDGSPIWDWLREAHRDSLPYQSLKTELGRKPMVDELNARARRLETLRDLPAPESYRGPVLFSQMAAGDLIQRALIMPQSHLREPIGTQAQPDFLASLKGRRFFPVGFKVVDRPNLQSWDQHLLFGHYEVDHQAQPAEDLDLVVDGRLRDYYLGKTPIFSTDHKSNGHWRYGGGFPGVVQVSGEPAQSDSNLVLRLRTLAQDEGIPQGLEIMRTVDEDAWKLLTHPLSMHLSLSDPGEGRGSFGIPAPSAMDFVDVKTGARTPVRGLVFPPIDSKSLRAIDGVGDKPWLLEPQASFSLLCPSLLFTLLDLKNPKTSHPRLPYLP